MAPEVLNGMYYDGEMFEMVIVLRGKRLVTISLYEVETIKQVISMIFVLHFANSLATFFFVFVHRALASFSLAP